MQQMKLSILICSLEKRKEQLAELLAELNLQITSCDASDIVEVMTEVDSKQITTGAKRNNLLNKASGKYICFIDDDDHIYPNYIKLILEATESDADCIATTGIYSINGGHPVKWRLSKDFIDEDKFDSQINEIVYFRRANHLTPVKRLLALQAMFPDQSNAEDKEYSSRLNPFLQSEVEIKELIYHYDYKNYDKEYT
jgi:glycosyltransferase involved in cell wall biosynthesis